MSPYFDVFLNSALAASVIPIGSEAGLYAMKAFGGFSMPLAVVLATTGATLGQLFNFYLGNLLFRLTSKSDNTIHPEKYQRVQGYFHKYGVFILLFCWAPIGNIFVIAAGFLKTPPKIALPLMMVGVAAHYGWSLL